MLTAHLNLRIGQCRDKLPQLQQASDCSEEVLLEEASNAIQAYKKELADFDTNILGYIETVQSDSIKLDKTLEAIRFRFNQ